ncbi:Acetyl esterase/lipase [Chitinophaga costaii]|uniref:Acetyl esterase/lipase n=1 Tax=Chitinophaga costaii TaxID=1335309 RepID=A0A1C4FL03_9BACT|nr:alpha/beta hydrolase [Chitinophaga costaii]PUZ29976.1 alpha/beta hydrolase [Chitinophaga costaii]SCC56650.1 Acetyl esterase/lipase [Chitinophaga costaii]
MPAKLKTCFFIGLFLPQFLFAQSDSLTLHLWPQGAPGFEARANEPEKGDVYISNIHNPSITVYFPPKEKANGAAVVICPGGGHHMLVINSEGRDPARYFNNLGVTAIVLKYRLARDTNSPYQIAVHAKQDALRAMRLVRSKAAQWHIDPNRIGLMGFSAGGEVTNMAAFQDYQSQPAATDPVDRLPAKPAFIILVYPGPLGVPDSIPPDAPPAFLVAANEDVCCSPPIIQLLLAYRKAGVPVEAHVYAKGNHAFNMGYHAVFQSIRAWPQRLTDWLTDYHFFTSAPSIK